MELFGELMSILAVVDISDDGTEYTTTEPVVLKSIKSIVDNRRETELKRKRDLSVEDIMELQKIAKSVEPAGYYLVPKGTTLVLRDEYEHTTGVDKKTGEVLSKVYKPVRAFAEGKAPQAFFQWNDAVVKITEADARKADRPGVRFYRGASRPVSVPKVEA
jgi:hypothetical protein